jgi:predicted ATP-grasp superfamily ATP-dependent carboligase
MRWRILVVAWSVAAVLVTVLDTPTWLAAPVVITFLTLGPGLALVMPRLAGDADGATLLATVVAVSWALGAVLATALLFAHAFGGYQVVVPLAGITILAALRPLGARRPAVAVQPMAPDADGTPLLVPERPSLDTGVAALIVRIGAYPVAHGSVAIARSLGRAGVEVHALTEGRTTPTAVSRYVAAAHRWRPDPNAPADDLVEALARVIARVPRPCVLLPVDDEAAVLVAERRGELGDGLLAPLVPRELPRRLASKRGLFDLARDNGMATPVTVFPRTADDIAEFAATGTFPVVVKNVDPFRRLVEPAVGSTTVLADAAALEALAARVADPTTLMLQEYVPRDDAEDWIFHGYFDAGLRPLVAATGVKLRSWPAHAGVTTRARPVDNPDLVELAVGFCRQIGYRGIVDLDLRLDRRDGEYKLVDFNPRAGAQCAMFRTEVDVDVVRAAHLDLSGRVVPPAPVRTEDTFVVGHLDLPARRAYRGGTANAPDAALAPGGVQRSWLAADDLAPAVAMLPRAAWMAVRRAFRRSEPSRRTARRSGHVRVAPNDGASGPEPVAVAVET